MLSLKHIENADDKENPNGLYRWAKLFAAKEWEDVKMIVENNDYMKSVASGIRVLTEDEKVRLACEARDMLSHDMASSYSSGAADKEKELRPIIEAQEADINKLAAEIAILKAQLANHPL